MESLKDEHARALAVRPVSVIYVSIEEPQPARRRGPGAGGLLRAATVCVHRLADYVDDLRRSLERYSH
jgi:hypothetical protein